MVRNLAKLAAPRSQAWINREPLFRLLDQQLEYPVVWIAAPAGAGKTVLAASYLQERKRPVLWYNLDSGDADPASFFFYLRQAAERFAPNTKLNLPSLTPDYLPGLDLFGGAFFREFYRIFTNNGGVLVLDNVQDAEQSPAFLQSLAAAACEIPPGVSLFCLSRSIPPPVLSRLTLNRTMVTLPTEALRWSMEETRQLAARLVPGAVGGEMVAAIHRKTQGWAAGLVLLLGQATDHGTAPVSISPAAEQTFFNYFAGEIMATLPEAERQFLLYTALLPNVTAEIAARLSGADNAAQLLSFLVEKNYFTVRLETPPNAYRYHPLFREFLLHQAANTLPQETIKELRFRAAQLLVATGEPESAVPLLIEAAAWEPLTGVVCTIAPQLIAHGRHQRLLSWLEMLSPEVINAAPWLLYWKAAALLPVDLRLSHHLFAAAFEVMQQRDDETGMAMAWAGAVETIVHALSHTERLFDWMNKLTVLQRRTGLAHSPELRALVAPQAAAICALHGKMAAQLEEWIPQAESLLSAPLDPAQRILASFALVTYFHWSGQEPRSLAVLKRQDTILASGVAPPLAVIVTKLSKAWFSWTYGEFDECTKAIEEGLAISAKSGVQHWVFLLLVQGAANALLRNDLHEAERFLERMEPLYPNTREMDRVYYHNELGRLEMLRGRADRALREQLIAWENANAVGAAYVIAETSFGLSQVYHAVGQLDLAAHYLAEVRYQAERYGAGPSLAFPCGLIETYYCLTAGDPTAAAEILAKTLSQARRQGYCAFGWWRQDVIAQLCHFALLKGIELEFTRNLIRQYHVLPPAKALGDSRWPWPVRITTFGRFSLRVNDEEITFDRKKQKRPLELLKALLAFGVHDVPETKLMDVLWPDADADMAHQNLKATVHRLRKLIGAQTIIVTEGSISLDRRRCWIDTTAMHALADETERQPSAGLLTDLQSIYRGEFLQNETDASWAITPREQYRALFLRTIERLGEALLAAGNYSMARNCYEFGLTVDPLIEHFYQGLMRSNWGLARPAEVQSVLARCRQVLRASLGLNCSAETEALAQRHPD